MDPGLARRIDALTLRSEGASQEDAANRVGVTVRTLQRWERAVREGRCDLVPEKIVAALRERYRAQEVGRRRTRLFEQYANLARLTLKARSRELALKLRKMGAANGSSQLSVSDRPAAPMRSFAERCGTENLTPEEREGVVARLREILGPSFDPDAVAAELDKFELPDDEPGSAGESAAS